MFGILLSSQEVQFYGYKAGKTFLQWFTLNTAVGLAMSTVFPELSPVLSKQRDLCLSVILPVMTTQCEPASSTSVSDSVTYISVCMCASVMKSFPPH